MQIEQILRDEDDDPDGNVAPIADIDIDEDVLDNSRNRTSPSSHLGRMGPCGPTETGRFIGVAWERAGENPLVVRPVTAFDSSPPRGHRRGQ